MSGLPTTPPTVTAGTSALPNAEEEILRGVRRQLSHAVRRICPARLSSHQEDIVQAALIRVYQITPGENRTGLSASYLWKVAFSVTIDEIRRQRRRPEETLEAARPYDLIHPTPGPEDRAMGRQSGRAILDCLAGLGEDRRLGVTLHLQGHTVPEASDLLGWSRKRVANLTYRGLDDLRRCLTAKGFHARGGARDDAC